jgi:dTDP-4-dehydrorhamnose reductase
MNIVIGKSGQLAQELKASMPKNDFVFLGRSDINLLNKNDIFNTLSKFNPALIINASAYTAVDNAETDIEAAFAINCKAVEYLAVYCEQNEVKFIHISTDFVFDGNNSRPYTINDIPNPINIYGKSKLAGEEAVQNIMSGNYSIIRTSWLYSSYGNNFVKTMIRLMNERSEIDIISDQLGCPTHTRTLVKLISIIMKLHNANSIYNCSDVGEISWYDFAVEILNLGINYGIIKKGVKLNKIKSNNFITVAKRPKYSVLKVNSYSNTLWSNNLKLFFEEYNDPI